MARKMLRRVRASGGIPEVNRGLPIPLVSDRTGVRSVRRLDLLSGVSGQLALAQSESELPARVEAGLRVLFESAHEVTLLLADRSGRELLPASDGGPAPGALAALCRGIAAIPAGLRTVTRTTPLLPYLMVPALVAPDFECGRGAMMSAPLLDQMRLLGLLILEGDPAAPDFTLGDLDALSAVAAQIALVMQRLRAERRATEQRRFERDLGIARQIQRRFLPALAPRVGGFRVAAEYRPAFEVGGDFYDLVPTGDAQATAVIGDVSGKGMAAALVMARVSSEFRRLARGECPPEALLGQLNAAMCEQSPDDSFVTAACLQLDAARRTVRVANAGHVLPLLRRAGGE